MKINHFPVDFTAGITPFFQVEDSERIRFTLTEFQDKPGSLKRVFDYLFEWDENLESIFLSGYVTEHGIKREKLGLGNLFSLTNWKNYKKWNDDLGVHVNYTHVKNLKSSDVYKYVLKLMWGGRHLYISFYNEEYLLYVNADVMDIISNESRIDLLKKQFSELYDRYYE